MGDRLDVTPMGSPVTVYFENGPDGYIVTDAEVAGLTVEALALRVARLEDALEYIAAKITHLENEKKG